MINLPRIIAISVGIFPIALLAQPTSPEEFIAAYRTAMQERSAEKLNPLTYSEGMSEADKQQAAQVQQMIFTDKEIDSITLAPLPADFQTVFIQRGKKIEPTYTPIGLIQTKYKDGGNGMNSASAPYAVIDGKYFLISSKSTDLGWSGPPDKTITFMVMGQGQDKVQIKAKWNASGVDQERIFKSPSSNFMGQFFKEVTVTSTQDDTDVTLTILEAGKKIFHSEPLKGKGTLEYKRES
jgi:hypothetical protein